MKIRVFLAVLFFMVPLVPHAFGATMGFKADAMYILKDESVNFTFTFDPVQENFDDSDVIIGEQDKKTTRITSLTIHLKLDSEDDYTFSQTMEVGGDEIVRETPALVFDRPGYYDVEAVFEWTSVDNEGNETSDRKKLDPIRINVANWIFSAGGKLGCIESTPALNHEGTILYVGSEDHFLYALNTDDGSERWRFPAGGAISSSPALDPGGNIHFASEDGFVYCLDPDGNLVWKTRTGGPVYSSPALDLERQSPDHEPGILYLSSTDNHLYALNMDDGTEVWRFKTGGKITSSPVIGFDGTVYIGSLDHFLYALNPDTGRLVDPLEDGTQNWPFDAESEITGSPALDRDGTLYFGTSAFGGGINDANGMYALSTTGEKKWFVQHGSGFFSSPAITPDGVICIGSHSNKMYGINRSGDELATYKKFSDDHMASPAVGSNDLIFCASKDGIFYGLNLKKGDSLNGREEIWQYRLDRAVTASSPAIKNGFVYVGTCGDNLGSIYSLFCDKDLEETGVEVHEDSPWPEFRGNSQNTGKTFFNRETVAPEVCRVSPAQGETRLDLSLDRVTVWFSRSMDELTVFEPGTERTDAYYGFTLEPFESGPETFFPDWNDDYTRCELFLPPGEAFKPYITYTATLLSRAGAADMAEDSENTTILDNKSWSFSFKDEEVITYDDSPASPCFISTITGKE